MKQVHANYTFNAATKTITLTGLNIGQDQLLLVTNTTRGIIYYNFASPDLKAVVSSGANTTIVLTDASTTGHSNTDKLLIHYENQSSTQPVTGTVAVIGSAIVTDDENNIFGVNRDFPVTATSLPLPTGAATSSLQSTGNTYTLAVSAGLGSTTSAEASSDTGTFSLIALFKRLLTKITSLVPSGLTTSSTRLLVDGSGVTQPVSGSVAVSSLPAISGTVNASGFEEICTHNFLTQGSFKIQNVSAYSSLLVGVVLYPSSGTPVIKQGWGDDADVTVDGGSQVYWSEQTFNGNSASFPKDFTETSLVYYNCNVVAENINFVITGGVAEVATITLYGRKNQVFALTDGELRAKPVTVSGTVTANNENIGAKADSSATTDTGTFSLISLFKRLLSKLPSLTAGNRIPVDGSGVTQPVSGTFWQTTQPVSGTFWQTTQPVSASSLPLPTGAASETTLSSVNTKIPSNLTVTSTRLLVDGSGVTQPTSDRGATGEATVTSYSSTTSATLKASNANRKLLTIYNEGAGNLHILYGNGTASTTNYSVKLATGDYLEVDKYTGQLTAIFASSGTARVTEIT